MTFHQLDAVHLAILEHCRNGPVSLKALERRVAPHTPLYRHAGELRRRGLLDSPKKGLWQTTEVGVRTLEEAKAGTLENPMDEQYPPLRLFPMPLRAFARLIMLADIARRYRLRETHHPFGLLFGDTMTLKTTTGQFLAYALGEDPARAIILTPTETGRSVGVRKTYAGRIASIRAALSWRFVCFDEFHKASPATKRTVVPYLMGQLRVPLENDVLDVRPVALVITNPFPGKTLREWTGLGSAELRRGMPCRVTAKDIPENTRFRGEEIVEAAKKAGPVGLPKPTGVRFRSEDAAAMLQSNLTTDARVIVDFETTAMLAEAMSGLTDDPLPFVIRDILTCYETVGLVDPTWRARLSGGVTPATVSTSSIQKPLTTREQTLAILEEVGHVIDGGLDAYVRVQNLDALLREHKLDPEVAARRIQTIAAWNKAGFPWSVLVAVHDEWKTTGNAEQFTHILATIVERFGSFRNWEKTLADQTAFLAKHGGSWDHVHEALLLRQELEHYGLTPKDGRSLLRRLAAEAARRNLNPNDAVYHIFDLVRAHDDLYAATEEHRKSASEEARRLQENRGKRAAQEDAWAEQQKNWANERSLQEAEMMRREQILDSQAIEIEFQKKEVDSLKHDRSKLEEESLALKGPLAVGKSIMMASQTGGIEELIAAAEKVVAVRKDQSSFEWRDRGRAFLDFERRLDAFVDHLQRPCIPLEEHKKLLAERDQRTAELHGDSNPEASGSEEGTTQ